MRNSRDKHSASLPPYTMSDLFQGENLDIIAAVLLITGKLRVNSAELYRGEPTVLVTLIGEYRKSSSSKSEKLAAFLEENGDMTVDDVLHAVRRRMQEEGGTDF
ncbi:hypothetical protein [Salibacterium aidingense]|uniref:hypothetical protein n=1 Tax=Salibacterium aidingense TaxID=384933 RepID=UPI0004050B89|nr:hypothetical protein [Salibacterium aidingense]